MSETTPFYSENAYGEKTASSSPELGYRQAYIKDLVNNMPSDRASVDETRDFIYGLLQWRRVSPKTASTFSEQLLWTGEELHRIDREKMTTEVKEYGLTASQAGYIVNDFLEIRDHYRAMQQARSENPHAPFVFKPKTVPDVPPGALFLGIVFIVFGAYVFYRFVKLLFF